MFFRHVFWYAFVSVFEPFKKAVDKPLRGLKTSDKARRLFEFKPNINSKNIDFNSCENQRALLQLQTGHIRLKEHQHKTRVEEHPYYDCGDPEIEEHYLIQCSQYTKGRKKMMNNLYNIIGIRQSEFTEKLLLTSGPYDPWKDHRLNINQEL